MAAYEVLLLNTAIPQIQAAQSGDTYVVPRDIAFTSNLTLNAGTANGVAYLNGSKVVTTGSALTFDGTTLNVGGAAVALGRVDVAKSTPTSAIVQSWQNSNDGARGAAMYLSGAAGSGLALFATTASGYPLAFGIDGTEKMRLGAATGGVGALGIGYTTLTSVGDSGLAVLGNVGIGTNTPGYKLDVQSSGNSIGSFQSTGANYGGVEARNSSRSYSLLVRPDTSNALVIRDETAGANRVILDTSGNVGIGTSSPSNKLVVSNGGANGLEINPTSGVSSGASLNGYNRSTSAYTPLTYAATAHYFQTGSSPSTSATITSGGSLLVNRTSVAGAELFNVTGGASGSELVRFYADHATNPYGQLIYYTNADPNGTANEFLACYGTAITLRASIRSNGGLANYSANNVNLASDERLKKDISPLLSTWDKLKAVEVVNFRYKDCNEGDPLLFGVIAQQVQPIVPDLVVVTKEAQEAVQAKDAVLDADGNVVEPAIAAKEATPEYYGLREQPMYWLAIKALQEAMARIETLEAEVAALKGA